MTELGDFFEIDFLKQRRDGDLGNQLLDLLALIVHEFLEDQVILVKVQVGLDHGLHFFV